MSEIDYPTVRVQGFFIEHSKRNDFSMKISQNPLKEEDYKSMVLELKEILISRKTSEELENIQKNYPIISTYTGEGEDPLGEFTVSLSELSKKDPMESCARLTQGDKFVIFKKYKNSKPHGYIIVYIGEVDKDKKVSGKWYITHSSDHFEMNLLDEKRKDTA